MASLIRTLLLLSILLPLPALAEPAAVVLSDGSAPDPAHLDAASDALSLEDARAVALPAPDAPWSLAGGGITLQTVAEVSTSAPAASIAAARRALDQLDAASAQDLLSAAGGALPAAEEPVPADQLREIYELLGQAAQELGDARAAAQAYDWLVTAAPDHELSLAPGLGYEDAWTEARRAALSRALRPLLLVHGTDVWLDGEAVDSGVVVSALPGRHLLQWREGGAVTGTWLHLQPGEGDAVAVLGDARQSLLTGTARHGLARAARTWLPAALSSPDVVVIKAGSSPLSGFQITGGALEPWQASAATRHLSMRPDRMRLVLGAGYAATVEAHADTRLASSFLATRLALGLRLVGPLHLRVAGDLQISEPLRVEGSPLDGRRSLLPGLLAGAALRPVSGVAQPFVALAGGLWIVPAAATADVLAAGSSEGVEAPDAALVGARRPLTPRVELSGGVDLIPAGGPLVVRAEAGLGAGFGLELRVGLLVGLRLGTSP